MEIEIKLQASAAALTQLRRHPALQGDQQSVQLATTYFDTPNGRLARAGASLRLRTAGDTREQTVKLAPANGGGHVQREEWTVPAKGDHPDPADFPAPVQTAMNTALAGYAVAALATVSVARTTHSAHFGGSLIEVAFDTGTISASGRAAPICELELELVEGRLADVLALALALPLGPELRWSVAAKGQRATALARDVPARAVRAEDVILTPAMGIADAFRVIAWNCLTHLLGNYGLVIEAGDNEALHQSRVAIRRLRAALSLFGDRLDSVEADKFRAAFGGVASAMGEAREMHVLLQELAKADAADGATPDAGDTNGPGLVSELTARRRAALADAGKELASESFQRLLFEFAGWVEALDIADAAAPETVPDFAARVLDHHRKRVKHAGRHLRAMPDHQLHRLRIKAKKLRYAVEFFASLAGPDERTAADAYARCVGKLQDKLGLLHDIAERSATSALFDGHEPRDAARLLAELERRLGPLDDSRNQLVQASARALDRLMALPRWWETAHRHQGEPHMGQKHDGHHGYQTELRDLQIRLTAMQRGIIAEGRKLLVIFEGRDAAGKDGTIKHIVEHMSPRDTRVVALGVPTEREAKAWYFQRWCEHLPVAGEIVLYNRSWYNRAGVERVMGFCSDAEYEDFMESVVPFEQMLVHSGLTLVKYYLDISKGEQKSRLREREHDPLKQWKISPIDKKAVRNWNKYSEARNAMLARTQSVFAPWVVVKADDKHAARLAVIRDVLARCGTHNARAEDLPDPATAFVYDTQALENGWLAE